MKGIGEEKCRLVLFSLVYAHGGFVAFGSVGVQLEAAFPPGSQGVLLLLVHWTIF